MKTRPVFLSLVLKMRPIVLAWVMLCHASVVDAAELDLPVTTSILEERETESSKIFTVQYQVTNTSTNFIEEFRAEIATEALVGLNSPDEVEVSFSRFSDSTSYYGIPPGVTLSENQLIVTCALADAVAIEQSLINDSLIAGSCHLASFTYRPLALTFGDPVFVSSIDQGNGKYHLQYELTSLTNTATVRFVSAKPVLDDFVLRPYTVSIAGGGGSLSIDPNETLTFPARTLVLEVNAEQEAAVRVLIETEGKGLRVEAAEIIPDAPRIFLWDELSKSQAKRVYNNTTLAPPDYLQMEQFYVSGEILDLCPGLDPEIVRTSRGIVRILWDPEVISSLYERISIGDYLRFRPSEFIDYRASREDCDPPSFQDPLINAYGTEVPDFYFRVNTKGLNSETGCLEISSVFVRNHPGSENGAFASQAAPLSDTPQTLLNIPAAGLENVFGFAKAYETSYTSVARELLYEKDEVAGRDPLTDCDIAPTESDAAAAQLFRSNFDMEPIVFNEVELIPEVTVSGQVLVRALDLDVQMAWRNRQPIQVEIAQKTSLYLNLIFESRGGADNRDLPDFTSKVDLLDFEFPVFSYRVPPAFDLECRMSADVDAGTDVFLPGKATVPIQAGVVLGGRTTFRDGMVTRESINEALLPIVPVSEIEEALQAQILGWLSARFDIGFQFKSESLIGLPPLIEGNAFVEGRVEADFQLDPLGEPWWSLDGCLKAFMGAETRMFGGEPVAATRSQIGETLSLVSTQAPGPLPIAESLLPITGRDIRWASVLETFETPAEKPRIEQTSDDGCIVLSRVKTNQRQMARLDSRGNVLWRRFFQLSVPLDFLILDDDSIIIVAENWTGAGNIIMAKLSPEGDFLWQKANDLSRIDESGDTPVTRRSQFSFERIVRAKESGEDVFYLCGNDPPSKSGMLLKTDATGEMIYLKEYKAENRLEFLQMKVASNGDLLVVGNGRNQMEGYPIPTNDATLTRISPDGTLLWSRFLFSAAIDQFDDLAEDPTTGDIYTVGNYFGTTQDANSGMSGIQVAKWSADGRLYKRVILIPDVTTALSFNFPSSCFWANDSLYLAGHMALDDERQTWLCRLTSSLGALFFTTLDGPNGEGPADIKDAGDGFLLAFESGALDPWGGLPVSAGGHVLVTKVPWEGLLRLHELTGIRTQFLKAQTRATYEMPNVTLFGCYETALDQAGGIRRLLGQEDFLVGDTIYREVGKTQLTGVVNDLVAVPRTNTFSSVTRSDLGERNARDLDIGSIENLMDWQRYYSFGNGDSDADGDGLNVEMEAFLGTNPYQSDSDPLKIMHHPTQNDFFQLSFTTGPASRFFDAKVTQSFDMSDYSEVFYHVPRPRTNENEQMEHLLDGPTNEVKEFFRLEINAIE